MFEMNRVRPEQAVFNSADMVYSIVQFVSNDDIGGMVGINETIDNIVVNSVMQWYKTGSEHERFAKLWMCMLHREHFDMCIVLVQRKLKPQQIEQFARHCSFFVEWNCGFVDGSSTCPDEYLCNTIEHALSNTITIDMMKWMHVGDGD